MDLSIERLVDSMRETLEKEGFVLYSKSPRAELTLLVMFHPGDERFVFFAFKNDSLGAYERVDAFVNSARMKALAFGQQEVQQEDGNIRAGDSE